jgi:hypothetical protein
MKNMQNMKNMKNTKKMLMAAALATSAVSLAAPAYADNDTSSSNPWGSAAPAVCTAETTVAPVLGDIASAPLRGCPEGNG